MVKLRVLISMELEGVTNVQPVDDHYEYFFTDEYEISGSKGKASFVWRCSNCKKEHSANFLPSAAPPSKSKSTSTSTSTSKSTAPIPYTSSSSGQFSPFIALDCRGLEFTEFHFAGKWKAEGEESGAAFEIDWDELRKEQGGEERWDDYDEDGGMAVAVSELRSKIERA
ncbi:hypothetical protein I307_02033 [Cryptococcus deuterogattii 99/473]|uniref:DUF866-domain-containing protein n=1 Tax=Cryptococcus deuterogattii Ram5 TaxID=1296110 RepID=A0A0D0T3W9_9TREE|nr:hypothetical protein I313_03803 [Cryptococcus deuterogattii Ram5]KIY58718.1 hypothetical protein I307_02033 [Cryptococcus deuterogattii 99/473]